VVFLFASPASSPNPNRHRHPKLWRGWTDNLLVAGKDSAEQGEERMAVLCWKTLLGKSKTDERKRKKGSKEARRTREKGAVTEVRSSSSTGRNTFL